VRAETQDKTGSEPYPDEVRKGAQPDEVRKGAQRPGEAGTGERPDEVADADGPDAGLNEKEIEDTLDRTVGEGRRRMHRGWAALTSTGLVGGIDVGTGVLAMLVVEARTGDKLLSGLAFAIGFIALTLARSELFTEDFLVPVSAVIARQSRLRSLMRLWVVTAATNLAGGWVFCYLIISSFPDAKKPAIEAGAYYTSLTPGWRSFALALLGGAVITLMTWMQHATESMGVKLVPAVTTGFLLAGLQLNHAIVASLLTFAGLQAGHTSYGYLDWAECASWAALGNMVGGIALVTLLRLLQVPDKVKEHVGNPSSTVTAR